MTEKARPVKVVLTLRVDPPLLKRIQREAESEGLSASAVIRRTLMRVHGSRAEGAPLSQ